MAFNSPNTAFGANHNTHYASVSPGMQEYNPHAYNAQYQPGPTPTYGHPTAPANDYKAPYNAVASGLQSPGSIGTTHFSHRRQAVQLARSYLFRWLVTVAICGAFAGVVVAYQNKGGMSSDDKHYFNGISSGLIICLSLNLMASLNAMARALKWRLLAAQTHSPRVFQLLVAFDSSQLKPLRLAIMRHRYMGLRLLCILWLSINLAAQIGLAAVGLTYSMDAQTGTQFSTLLTEQTTGRTAILSTISGNAIGLNSSSTPANSPANVSAQRETAFDYGVGAVYLGFHEVTSNDTTEYFDSVHYETDQNRFRLRMVNYAADEGVDDLFNVLSERVIYNNATCNEVVARVNFQESEFLTNISFALTNGSSQAFYVERPIQVGTTYITNTEDVCGPRCVELFALVTAADMSQKFYQCQSEVSPVRDWYTGELITRPELQLPDTQAQIIAGSIGWGGIAVGASVDTSFLPDVKYQAAFYGNASLNSPTNLPDVNYFAEAYVGAFPASVMAIMNRNGPKQVVDNILVRQDASDLHVHWDRFILVLGIVGGVQALLAVMTVVVIFYYRVIVHDDEPYALTALLGPTLPHVPSGTLKNGKVIASSITSDLVYTHNPTESPREPQSVAVTDGHYRQDAKFPEGEYV